VANIIKLSSLVVVVVLMKYVPLVMEMCIVNIEDYGLHSQGIYRVPGNAGVVHELQEQLDRVSI